MQGIYGWCHVASKRKSKRATVLVKAFKHQSLHDRLDVLEVGETWEFKAKDLPPYLKPHTLAWLNKCRTGIEWRTHVTSRGAMFVRIE